MSDEEKEFSNIDLLGRYGRIPETKLLRNLAIFKDTIKSMKFQNLKPAYIQEKTDAGIAAIKESYLQDLESEKQEIESRLQAMAEDHQKQLLKHPEKTMLEMRLSENRINAMNEKEMQKEIDRYINGKADFSSYELNMLKSKIEDETSRGMLSASMESRNVDRPWVNSDKGAALVQDLKVFNMKHQGQDGSLHVIVHVSENQGGYAEGSGSEAFNYMPLKFADIVSEVENDLDE